MVNLMLSPPPVLFDAGKACSSPETLEFHPELWGGPAGLGNMTPCGCCITCRTCPPATCRSVFKARGPNNSLTMAEASGNLALGEAYRILTRRKHRRDDNGDDQNDRPRSEVDSRGAVG